MTGGRRRQPRGPARPGDSGSTNRRSRWLLALAAVALLSLTGYAFYYLDSLPQAVAVDPRQAWRSEAGREMRLRGIEPGSVLAFDLRGRAAASLAFGTGARLAPDAELPPGLDLAGGARLYASPEENVSLLVTVTGGGGRGILHVASGRDRDEVQWLRLRSEGAGLSLELAAIPGTRDQEHSFISLGSGAGTATQSARVTLPPGADLQLRLAVADLPRLNVEPAHPDRADGRFPLSALEIGRAGAGGFERLSAACGAPAGALLWRRLVPAVRSGDCGEGRLALTAFELDGGAAASLDGTGFVVTDGRTEVWQGFRALRQNDVVKTALGFLLASLVGWAFVRLRGGGEAAAARRGPR